MCTYYASINVKPEGRDPGIVGHSIPLPTLGKLTKILGPIVMAFNFVCQEEKNQITS